MAGLHLDPWQQFELDGWLEERADGRWRSFENVLVVSRQNGKGSLIEARELVGLFLLGEQLIIHSAHLFATSIEAFRRLSGLIQGTPELDAQVRRYINTNGKEGIELYCQCEPKCKKHQGARVLFLARTKGAARGFTADCLILDECMFLPEEVMAAMLPTLAAVPNPQVIYTGSAGNKESTQMGRLRTRALKGDDPRLRYSEYSVELCNRNCRPDCADHLAWDSEEAALVANPGLGIRLRMENVHAERRTMDEYTFKMERLGIGDYPLEANAWGVIDEQSWRERHDPGAVVSKRGLCFGVDVTPDRDWSAIAVAGQNENMPGYIHGELTKRDELTLDFRQGTDWLLPRLTELCKTWRAPVVIDPATQAKYLIEPLEDAGVKVVKVNARDYGEACGSFLSACVPARDDEPSFTHSDQAPLATALSGAATRPLREFWAWDRQEASVNISPVVALTLAFWGAHQGVNATTKPFFGTIKRK